MYPTGAATGRARQTPANQKSVLVVEDEGSVRVPLTKSLKQYGFRADPAKDVAQAQEIIRSAQYPYDVAVLDILLEDPENRRATGFELGKYLRQAQPELPPEIVIYSGNYDSQYYSDAIDLEVSEYIKKASGLSVKTIVSRIGTWALRRALSPVRTEIGRRIEQIAQEDLDTPTAIKRLCAEVIKPEVDASLHVPTLFLLTDRRGTQNVISNPDLPAGYDDIYARIQEATFKKNGDAPFTLQGDALNKLTTSREFREHLSGSSFIHLHEEGDLRLSLGILKTRDQAAFTGESDPQKLATLLQDRFRPPVVKLLRYLSRIEAAVAQAERKTLLEHTSAFCMYVGQTHLEVLAESVENEEIETTNKCFQKLQRLARDLNATANEFSRLSLSEPATVPKPQVSARAVVDRSWDMIKEQQLVDKLNIKHEGKDVKLPISEQDLFVAVLRLMQWMAQRQDKMPGDVAEPQIEVKYSTAGDRREIRFTDHSRRLSAPLRRKLFEPFTLGGPIVDLKEAQGEKETIGLYLPLYLAKTVITVKNKGELQDRTDELKSPFGHCFTINF